MWLDWISLGIYILAAIWTKYATTPFILPGLRFLTKMSLGEFVVHTAILLLAMLFLIVNRWHSKKSINLYIKITSCLSMLRGLFLSIFAMCVRASMIRHARSLASEFESAPDSTSLDSIYMRKCKAIDATKYDFLMHARDTVLRLIRRCFSNA